MQRFLVEPIVAAALREDLGRAGDVTTDAIVAAGVGAEAAFVAREPGRIAGLLAATIAFELLESGVRIETSVEDGAVVAAGTTIARVIGSARTLLTGERTALNFLGHLSGIATRTAAYVDAVLGTKARIVCTRKTTPGLRALEKAAVRAGGGQNHRFGLDDAVLIKDNHLLAAGGIRPAVERVRANVGHLVKIEVEVDTFEQLDEALALDVDLILLDNMTAAQLARAVKETGGRAILEASGGVTLDNVRRIAESGVDLISVGALTHSTQTMDIGFDFLTGSNFRKGAPA